MHNLSIVDDAETARTRPECAMQRAENLAALGVYNVLELCVGPSLPTLERAYRSFGIEVAGNDVDPRWPASHPCGRWVVGDALTVNWDGFDAIVFAPPLSRGCTGRREDALRIGEVRPAYTDFIRRLEFERALGVMVLPARALATRRDRDEFWKLMAIVPYAQVVPLTAGRRRVVKYHDAYIERRRG